MSARRGRDRGAGEAIGPALTLVLHLAMLAAFAGMLAGALVFVGAQFGSPGWLHLGWLAPALLLLAALAGAARRRARLRMGEAGAVARLVEDRGRGMRFVRPLLAAMAILSLAVACARPRWGQSEERFTRRGVDVFILIDTSRSMLAEDVKPSRLARARLALSSLVDRLGGDRVALIAFAGDARIACPLTTDHGAVKLFLDLLEADMLQRPGTAIGPALSLVAQSVEEDSDRSVAVVLITDGEDHEGGVEDALEDLRARGVVVHAVAIGSTDGAPVPVVENGRPGWLRDAEGVRVMTRLGLETLKTVTAETGGVLAQASSSEIELASIASAIGSMEQTELSARQARIRPDRQQAFLALAFALLALELFLPDGSPLVPRRGLTRTERLAAAALAARKRAASPQRREAA